MTAPSGGTTTDAARYLRDTSKLMRERADASDTGPRWETAAREDDDSWQVPLVQGSSGGLPVAECNPVDPELANPRGNCDAEHIASWDPTVARAVAELLDMAAGDFDDVKAACVGTPYEPDEVMSEQIRVNVNAALAIARAYRRDLP